MTYCERLISVVDDNGKPIGVGPCRLEKEDQDHKHHCELQLSSPEPWQCPACGAEGAPSLRPCETESCPNDECAVLSFRTDLRGG